MKITHCLVAAFFLFSTACSSVMTRKEAAEDAKRKSVAAENAPPPMGPIDEDDVNDANIGGVQKPIDDQVLDDELAKMGIDPNNLDGRKKQRTPEPEVQPIHARAGHPQAHSVQTSGGHGNFIPGAVVPAPKRKPVAKKKPAPKKKTKKPIDSQ